MRALALFLFISIAAAEIKREEPVGLMLLPGGAKIIRPGAETPLSAKAGEVLFAGDAIRTEAAAASFLYCPGKSSQSLAPSGEALLESAAIKVKTGKLADQKTVASCFLPPVVRLALASQQHYGVSMTRGAAAEPAIEATPKDKWPQGMASEMAPVDQALAANASDQAALIARAATFEKYKLPGDALLEYRRIGKEFPEAVWVKGKIFELQEAVAIAASQAPLGGQTFALLIGVSQYQKLPQDQWLQFAHADASTFAAHVRSQRGGALPPENVVELTNEKATTAALRNAFQTFLKGRAGKQDTVVILIAGHGTVEVPGSKQAFILTYDSDPQDLAGTALPMDELQELVSTQLSKVGRVAFFVDVCRAGVIASIKSKSVNRSVEALGEAEGQMLGIMASRATELSFEGPEFGGGHGAFSYALLKGLNGAADKNGDGIVDVNETINYVQSAVPAATNDKQHPREFGTMDNSVPLSFVQKPGINLTRLQFPIVYDSQGDPAYLAAGQATPSMLSAQASAAVDRYSQALDSGRLDPNARDSAFALLRELEPLLNPEQLRAQTNRLRVALENRGQQVILRYLTGDQIPQQKSDFEHGADLFRSARVLTPESLFLDSRQSFCEGRAMLFDKKYSEATGKLEYSIRLDPDGAQAYNALGIAYLEQARFGDAIPAFRDAIRRAPHWAYPLHNLALAYAETGDYDESVRAYQQAMKLTPQYAYLPYNLGLVYQRLNRRREAEASYRKAIALAPDSAEPYNALGSLKAGQRKDKEAEQFYRTALDKNPKLLAARHNLGLLLASQRSRVNEAIDLWRQNLRQDPEFLASRLSLAGALESPGEGIREYREIVRQKPDYVAARLALANLLLKSGDAGAARAEIQAALQNEPASATILEQLGDLERSQNRAAEAGRAYEQALQHAGDPQTKKRIRKKLKP
jgi:tetratricopeptide (TPR) repeat protein